MTQIRFIEADELRARVRFEDLLEPVSRAFQETSAGRAQNGLIVMFPAGKSELGDVYVKTGVLCGHDAYIVKVSPWFAMNLAHGQEQGGKSPWATRISSPAFHVQSVAQNVQSAGSTIAQNNVPSLCTDDAGQGHFQTVRDGTKIIILNQIWDDFLADCQVSR